MADESYAIDADPFEQEEPLVGEPEDYEEEVEETEEIDDIHIDDEFSYQDDFQPIITPDNKRIPDNERFTMNTITPLERASIIGARAEHLARGAPAMISEKNLSQLTILQIAEKEYEEGKIPFKVKRVVDEQKGLYEIWGINELVSFQK